MKLEFIPENEVPSGRGRKSPHAKLWAEFIEELYKHPNKWAKFPKEVEHSSYAYNLAKKYADIKISVTGGNGLALDDPNKKLWTVYVQYIPKPEDTDLF